MRKLAGFLLFFFALGLLAPLENSYGQNAVQEKRLEEILKYYKASQFDQAKEKLEFWLSKSPADFPLSGFLMLGNIYAHQKNFPVAVKIYEKGMGLSENKFAFLLNLAQTYRHMKEHQKSLEILDKIKDKASFYPEIHLFAGMSHFEMRDRMKTIGAWESYLVVNPSGVKPDKVRKALAWLKRKDFQWPEDLDKKSTKDTEDLKKFFEDLKDSINKDRIKDLKDKPNLKEEKLEIKDKGKVEGDKFDEIER